MAIAIGDDIGLPRDELDRLASLEPHLGESFEADKAAASRYLQVGEALIERLPARPQRSAREQTAVETLHRQLRATRLAFLRRDAPRPYGQLTDDVRRFVRVEVLV